MGRPGAQVLPEIVATGRCYWQSLRKNSRALSLGAARPAKPIWRTDQRGWQEPILEVTLAAVSLPLSPPWYVDEQESCCGPLETGLPPDAAAAWLLAPKLSPEQSPLLSQELPGGALPSLPLPVKIEIEIVSGKPPVPCLRLRARIGRGNLPSSMKIWRNNATWRIWNLITPAAASLPEQGSGH